MGVAGLKRDFAVSWERFRNFRQGEVSCLPPSALLNWALSPWRPTISTGKTKFDSQLKNAQVFRLTRLREWKPACDFPAQKQPRQRYLGVFPPGRTGFLSARTPPANK